jgi:hypothetical protein
MGGDARDPITYLSASGLAALINFPLWKAAAIGQSGFAATGNSLLASARILFGPPYKGVAATLFGMTWARAAIFYGCDVGKDMLLQNGSSMALASWLPSIIISTFVQVANQPIVRGTVTIQNPASTHASLGAALVDIYAQRGLRGLWHGTGASVLKTVPKYATAVYVKDFVAARLPPPPSAVGTPEHRNEVLRRSAVKSVAAGVAGAALTNPLDVIRNEMFKTDEGTLVTVRRLLSRDGLAFMHRGLGRNMLAVAAPVGLTIFLTDAFADVRETKGAPPRPAQGEGRAPNLRPTVRPTAYPTVNSCALARACAQPSSARFRQGGHPASASRKWPRPMRSRLARAPHRGDSRPAGCEAWRAWAPDALSPALFFARAVRGCLSAPQSEMLLSVCFRRPPAEDAIRDHWHVAMRAGRRSRSPSLSSVSSRDGDATHMVSS